MTIFRSFRSTVSPFLSRQWPSNLKLLVDPVTGAPAGIESVNANGPDGIWTPIDLTAAQIASPTTLMIADLNATYRLNVAPYTRYQSNGTTLVAVTGGGVFLPLAGGTMTGAIATSSTLLIGGSGGVSGGSRAWAGTDLSQVPITMGPSPLTWTGTTGSMGSAPLFQQANIVANMDASGAQGGVIGSIISLHTGTSMKGGVQGTGAYINIDSATVDAGFGVEYTAGRFGAFAFNPSNNVNNSVMAATFQSQLSSFGGNNATGYAHLVGAEFVMSAAFAPLTQHGIYVMQYSSAAAPGTNSDAAIGIWNQFLNNAGGTSGGWKVGVEFGTNQAGLSWPIATTGTVIKATANPSGDNMVAANGIDFSAVAFSGNSLAFPNFVVTGAGVITAPAIGNGTTALQIAGSGSWSANGAIATALSSVGPTGSHTTVQKWFTVKDDTGTTRYIPGF